MPGILKLRILAYSCSPTFRPRLVTGERCSVELGAGAVFAPQSVESARALMFSEEDHMRARQLVIGTLAGAATVLVSGYLIFTAALGNFYAYAMNAGSATGVAREPQLFWAVA